MLNLCLFVLIFIYPSCQRTKKNNTTQNKRKYYFHIFRKTMASLPDNYLWLASINDSLSFCLEPYMMYNHIMF